MNKIKKSKKTAVRKTQYYVEVDRHHSLYRIVDGRSPEFKCSDGTIDWCQSSDYPTIGHLQQSSTRDGVNYAVKRVTLAAAEEIILQRYS